MTFNASNLPDLDECVVSALTLFMREHVPAISLGRYKRPLFVGSGNAAVTGKILFRNHDAVFANESNYKDKLRAVKGIDGAVLISASGGKDAPIIARDLRKRNIHVSLFTNNANAPARKLVDEAVLFPKQAEPYTYNTSTYMGMILAATKENPKKILDYIMRVVKPRIPRNLRGYAAYFILVPDKFDSIREMFLTKFDELFGPRISGRVFTPGQARHAKTVIPSDTELFFSIGCNNNQFGRRRLEIPLPDWADYAAVMAIGYYFIGQIQKQNPPYFKDNIEAYAKKASEMFGQEIKPIVE